ncbi:MAG TPA: fatty acid desaturase [Methylomirabilota bacterium]|nr:fatty acid desaturase [Methylomirabilota bacterium]
MIDEPLVRFTAHQLPRQELHPLMARSDGPAFRRAAAHLGALAVTGALLWRLRATGWALPLLVAHGYVLAFVFCAFHETAHRTAFRTRWLNTALGTLAGLLIVWPYRNYRVYHWEHHRFTQDEARDPELYFAKPTSVGAYLLALTGVPNLIRRVSDLLRLAGGRADRPWMVAPERRPLIREARIYLGVYLAVALASALTGSPIVLLLWIAPLLVGQAFLRPYLLAEHTACGSTRDGLENTRTTRTLALVRLFAWNMPYHAEHHAYPAVPFHALPRLHGHVRARLANLEPGYVAATVKVNRYLFARARGPAE